MGQEVERSPRHTISLVIVLAVVWLMWSGHYTAFVLILGALSCGLVVFLSARMRIIDNEGQPLSWGLVQPVLYFPWLAIEVVKANLDVAYRVLHPSLPVSPVLARVPAPQRTDLGRVVYADSITLTPGTVSIELGEGDILVHALSEDGIADLLEGEMARRVCQLEGEA